MIIKDLEELKKMLPSNIFTDVYIRLMGRFVKRLKSNEDEYLEYYVNEKWRKLSKEYNTSGLPLPCVIYVGWLFKEGNAEFNGKEIILYVLEEGTLIHEMIHYCQFSRNPYKLKSIIFQTEEEIEARKKREIEAYFISQRVIGQPISMQEAEKRAIASMHGRSY